MPKGSNKGEKEKKNRSKFLIWVRVRQILCMWNQLVAQTLGDNVTLIKIPIQLMMRLELFLFALLNSQLLNFDGWCIFECCYVQQPNSKKVHLGLKDKRLLMSEKRLVFSGNYTLRSGVDSVSTIWLHFPRVSVKCIQCCFKTHTGILTFKSSHLDVAVCMNTNVQIIWVSAWYSHLSNKTAACLYVVLYVNTAVNGQKDLVLRDRGVSQKFPDMSSLQAVVFQSCRCRHSYQIDYWNVLWDTSKRQGTLALFAFIWHSDDVAVRHKTKLPLPFTKLNGTLHHVDQNILASYSYSVLNLFSTFLG